jgi:ABC-type branched-subunit amino acid transport system permease subunit
VDLGRRGAHPPSSWNLTYSSYGRALAAIREDEIAAEAAGIPTTRYKVLAFAVSAMFTGLAGALYAHDATGGQHIDPGRFASTAPSTCW